MSAFGPFKYPYTAFMPLRPLPKSQHARLSEVMAGLLEVQNVSPNSNRCRYNTASLAVILHGFCAMETHRLRIAASQWARLPANAEPSRWSRLSGDGAWLGSKSS